MTKMEHIFEILLSFLLLLTGCGTPADPAQPTQTATPPGEVTEVEVGEVEQITVGGKTVYLYVPRRVKDAPETKVPMVLFMCGTTCDPLENMVDSGWVDLAEREGIIVISPDYNNYATYSETGFLISVVDYMLANYPVDAARVYSTGFSNGGAASVALTRDYPQYFAAISAMGWMVDLDNRGGVFEAYDMPFQVVQGDGEFTVQTSSGAMAVMRDEQTAIRSLFLYNEMIGPATQPNYDETPYWGYKPDDTRSEILNDRQWQFCDYYKEGFSAPFAQLVTVEDSEHRCRPEEAKIAWAFFRQYSRDRDGKIVSLTSAPIERAITVREYRNIKYDTLSSAQTYDLFLPSEGNGPFPLLVFVHGGGWFGGDKADNQKNGFIKLLEHGYAVASLNYRLSGEAPHPAGIIDCKTALRHIQAHKAEYHIDTDRIAVAGDSSGGHYALMLAFTMGNPDFEDLSRGNEGQDVQIKSVVAWYPATDLAETMRTVQSGEYSSYGAQFAWDNISRYVGKTIRDVGDESLVLASPINYVTSDIPPVLLQHGNADVICPMDQSQRLYQAIVQTAGENRVTLDILDGASHGDKMFETDENMAHIAEFLNETLK